VEVVMSEVTREELIALLLKVEGNRPDSLGICSQWYRNPEGPQAADTITALQSELAEARAEVERLRDELRKAKQAQWFYLGDNCESDSCRYCIDECISEDFEWDNKPEGDHVLLISGARPVPDMWISLHYYTEAEKEARDSNDKYTYTVHHTKEEAEVARQALAGEKP
jgi:hypothetical protein